jgi:hypothetical protein
MRDFKHLRGVYKKHDISGKLSEAAPSFYMPNYVVLLRLKTLHRKNFKLLGINITEDIDLLKNK